jgi:methionine-rich copper-binding protein CopC
MRLHRFVYVFIFGVVATLMSVSAASGHSQLVSSDPVDGSVLSAPPTQVVLTFNEALLKEAVDVAIANGAGEAVSGAVATAVGAIVTIPWPSDLPPDNYSVSYRIVSGDGHPITGSIGFSYTSASSSPSVAPPEATPEATPEVSPEEPPTSEPAPGFPIGLVGLILALAATITVIILARRTRR